jgi:hypothetical protein
MSLRVRWQRVGSLEERSPELRFLLLMVRYLSLECFNAVLRRRFGSLEVSNAACRGQIGADSQSIVRGFLQTRAVCP